MTDIGKIKAGETLFVSGAAGAVGSVTCQIGKIMGLKVVAIAGSDDKVEWLKKELGVDVAINYNAPDFRQQVIAAGFADVYFDNVGGDILNLMMTRMAMKGRVVLCGVFPFLPTGPWCSLTQHRIKGAISDYSMWERNRVSSWTRN